VNYINKRMTVPAVKLLPPVRAPAAHQDDAVVSALRLQRVMGFFGWRPRGVMACTTEDSPSGPGEWEILWIEGVAVRALEVQPSV